MSAPIDKILDELHWLPTMGAPPEWRAGDTPIATHSAILNIGGFSIRAYMLNDGTRILDARDVATLFGGAIRW